MLLKTYFSGYGDYIIWMFNIFVKQALGEQFGFIEQSRFCMHAYAKIYNYTPKAIQLNVP